jgi:hypothetical protein
VKPPKEYSKKEKIFLYSLTAVIIVFLIGGSLWKDHEYNRTLSEGEKLKVRIRSVYCTSGRGQSGLFFLDRKNKMNHANVNHKDCYKYREGDTITVLHNEKLDWYYIAN